MYSRYHIVSIKKQAFKHSPLPSLPLIMNFYSKKVYRKFFQYLFVPDDGFRKLRNDPRIISLTLDLYFKGVSLRKIADHLKQFYGLNVSHVTVYNWIKRFISIISEYVGSLKPQLSGN